MTTKSIASNNGGIQLETQMRFQLSDGPNLGTSVPLSMLPVFLPDPDSPVAGAGPGTSEFITSNAGTNWTVTVFPVVDGVVGAALAIPGSIPATTGNVYWIPLDPAVFDTAVTRNYRVEIRDTGANLAEQFDFAVFNHNVTAAGGTVDQINDKIRRIAGLLGYRQRVAYSDYLHGVARTAEITLLGSDLATAIAQYRVKRTMDAASNILGETSVALDSTNLGVTYP